MRCASDRVRIIATFRYNESASASSKVDIHAGALIIRRFNDVRLRSLPLKPRQLLQLRLCITQAVAGQVGIHALAELGSLRVL